MLLTLPTIERCPICGNPPDIGLVEPWDPEVGPQPYYAYCFNYHPYEHVIITNGDSRLEVIRNWNEEVHITLCYGVIR